MTITPPNVLIVGTERASTRLLLEVLASRGIRGTLAATGAAAADHLERGRWDLVVTVREAPEVDGLAVVRAVKAREPELPVVLLGREPTVRDAVEAVRAGCEDVLVEPTTRETFEALLAALVPNHAVPVEDEAETADRCLYRIIGRSPGIARTVALARKVAPTSVPVLVQGESGTGKELVAHLVHRAGRRAGGPYIRVNCAALSESLLESELFGHERGAFTGAVRDRKGRFERADGGTLLLDEVTETGPRLQAELLRVLEQQDFERVGGSASVRVNVRIVSTTNRDLPRLVREGRFRADLYYRLAGVRLAVPPLRHRREDLPGLVWHFVNLFAREVRRAVRHLDPEMMDLFDRYDWPGNVRQLRNVVRTALILGEGDTLSLAEAPWLRAELEMPRAGRSSLRLREVEKETILKALEVTGRHQARAAELLGITDRTLRDKLRRYREEDEKEDPAAGEAAPDDAAAEAALSGAGDPTWLRTPA